jgi:Protein of unknown function (DUF3306)
MTADNERFLSRWSRLKTETQEAGERPPEREPDPAPPAPARTVGAKEASAAPVPAEPSLPPLDSLQGLASEYTEFLKPGVDESLRRSALKKLFSDPYFETFERFEAYCEDYTKGEPIPAAMLKALEHAKGLLFDEKKEEKEEVAQAPEPGHEVPVRAQPEAQAPAAPPRPEEKT